MIWRGAVAVALALGAPSTQAEVVAMRTGGVMFLRGGAESPRANAPLAASARSVATVTPTRVSLIAPRATFGAALPDLASADDDRAVPFIGLPGALHRLVAHVEPALPRAAAMQAVMPLVTRTAADLRMDPALLMAVIHVESGFNAAALSPKGAVGLMQLMPATAGRYGSADPREPSFNVRAGASHLQYLLGRYGDLSLALAAYNAGEGAVERHGMRVPPYAETQQYVPRVMALYRDYQARDYQARDYPSRDFPARDVDRLPQERPALAAFH